MSHRRNIGGASAPATTASLSAEALPHEQADDGTRGRDHDLADDVIGGEPEQPGEKAADEGADDADDEVGQELLLALHVEGGDGAGDQPDDEKHDEVENHGHVA